MEARLSELRTRLRDKQKAVGHTLVGAAPNADLSPSGEPASTGTAGDGHHAASLEDFLADDSKRIALAALAEDVARRRKEGNNKVLDTVTPRSLDPADQSPERVAEDSMENGGGRDGSSHRCVAVSDEASQAEPKRKEKHKRHRASEKSSKRKHDKASKHDKTARVVLAEVPDAPPLPVQKAQSSSPRDVPGPQVRTVRGRGVARYVPDSALDGPEDEHFSLLDSRWREPIETFSYDMDRAERTTEVVPQFRSTGSSQRNKETHNPWSGRHELSPSPSPKSRHAFEKGGDDSSPNELPKDRVSLRDEKVLHSRKGKNDKKLKGDHKVLRDEKAKHEKHDKNVKQEKHEKYERSEKHERNDKQEKPEKLERPKKTWKEDKPKICESKVERKRSARGRRKVGDPPSPKRSHRRSVKGSKRPSKSRSRKRSKSQKPKASPRRSLKRSRKRSRQRSLDVCRRWNVRKSCGRRSRSNRPRSRSGRRRSRSALRRSRRRSRSKRSRSRRSRSRRRTGRSRSASQRRIRSRCRSNKRSPRRSRSRRRSFSARKGRSNRRPPSRPKKARSRSGSPSKCPGRSPKRSRQERREDTGGSRQALSSTAAPAATEPSRESHTNFTSSGHAASAPGPPQASAAAAVDPATDAELAKFVPGLRVRLAGLVKNATLNGICGEILAPGVGGSPEVPGTVRVRLDTPQSQEVAAKPMNLELVEDTTVGEQPLADSETGEAPCEQAMHQMLAFTQNQSEVTPETRGHSEMAARPSEGSESAGAALRDAEEVLPQSPSPPPPEPCLVPPPSPLFEVPGPPDMPPPDLTGSPEVPGPPDLPEPESAELALEQAARSEVHLPTRCDETKLAVAFDQQA